MILSDILEQFVDFVFRSLNESGEEKKMSL
jgi:hypothetical protein